MGKEVIKWRKDPNKKLKFNPSKCKKLRQRLGFDNLQYKYEVSAEVRAGLHVVRRLLQMKLISIE